MSSEIIQMPDDNNGIVNLGNDVRVSMQLVQDIYNEITGKTEKLNKSYTLNHQTEYEDLIQLDVKLLQLLEQYNVVSQNCAVTLYHTDEKKQQFSSFDRFKMYDRSSLSAVENIRLEYNFLIILPKVAKPQSYKIEIDVHSRAAILSKSKEQHGFTKKFMLIMGTKTANVEIDYIDYTVARTFQTAIDEWFGAIKNNTTPKWVDFIQKNSEHIPFIAKYVTATALTFGFYSQFSTALSSSTELGLLFKLGLVAFATIYILSGVALKLGNQIDRAIETLQPTSYLRLTRGDEITISALKKDNFMSFVNILLNSVAVVSLNVFSNWITRIFGI